MQCSHMGGLVERSEERKKIKGGPSLLIPF